MSALNEPLFSALSAADLLLRPWPPAPYEPWRDTPPADTRAWAGRLPVSDADLARLTTPTPPIEGDPINAFTRMKLREDGFYRLLFPCIPEGAPWWETGWRISYVVKQVRHRGDAARKVAARSMTRREWKAWHGMNRAGSRDHDAEVQFKRKLAENMAQLARVAALIRGAGRVDG